MRSSESRSNKVIGLISVAPAQTHLYGLSSAGVVRKGREGWPEYPFGLLLVGRGARQARESRWCGGEVQGRQSEGAALG